MEDYSVPDESRTLLVDGILKNRLHNDVYFHDLYDQCLDYADYVEFYGSRLPSIAVNWRFAESINSLKGLEACLINAYLVKRFGVSPCRIRINTDHAQLILMSAFLIELNPSNEDSEISPTGLRDLTDKYSDVFPNGDIYKANSSLYRRAAFNIYETRDKTFFHIHGSLNPNPTLEALEMPLDRPEITEMDESFSPFIQKLHQSESTDLDTLLNDKARQAATICWTADEYARTEHGQANANTGLYKIYEVPSSTKEQKPCWSLDSRFNDPSRPLLGLKVIDLTRVIAAPAITRGLAELGASVLRVTTPDNPDFSGLHPDLNWGKWNCFLNFRKHEDRQTMRKLILEADVVVNGYRPSVLDKYGFGEQGIMELIAQNRKEGIIYIKENCYGWQGPWANRSGWQPISDANTGISWGFGKAMGLNEPVTPVFPNSDYCTGVAGACAALHGLILRGTKGGSYVIDTALNYYNSWLAQTVGTYPQDVWDDVWNRNGRQVFRCHHSMNITLPKYLEKLKTSGKDTIFRKEHFEIRESKALGLTIKCVKPILEFQHNQVIPGYNIGTRGNGVDKAAWPDDPMMEIIE